MLNSQIASPYNDWVKFKEFVDNCRVYLLSNNKLTYKGYSIASKKDINGVFSDIAESIDLIIELSNTNKKLNKYLVSFMISKGYFNLLSPGSVERFAILSSVFNKMMGQYVSILESLNMLDESVDITIDNLEDHIRDFILVSSEITDVYLPDHEGLSGVKREIESLEDSLSDAFIRFKHEYIRKEWNKDTTTFKMFGLLYHDRLSSIYNHIYVALPGKKGNEALFTNWANLWYLLDEIITFIWLNVYLDDRQSA